MPPPIVSSLELHRAPIIAEALRIGAFGQLITFNTVDDPTMPSLPEGVSERPRLSSVEETIVSCVAEGMTNDDIIEFLRPKGVDLGKSAVGSIVDRLTHGVDVSNRAHLVRRAAEWPGGITLPGLPVLRREELAELVSPRQLVILGLVSHGLEHKQIAEVTGLGQSLVTSQLRRCNERLVRDEQGHVGLTIAHALASRALCIDDYMTTDYVIEGMQRLMDPDRRLEPPAEQPDFRPFPWPAAYIASARRRGL